ncbi:hypothetical protein DPMN_114654 [Dreissena polymorpha]|uniref:Uncharacterized protein n=1 Tax=Dreissena polymorpha TaxID=45954 RepID=A0A9D4KL12_DREPO|nr:hypothetical protein DPMN_114654 [Dreissena polymorpha]
MTSAEGEVDDVVEKDDEREFHPPLVDPYNTSGSPFCNKSSDFNGLRYRWVSDGIGQKVDFKDWWRRKTCFLMKTASGIL